MGILQWIRQRGSIKSRSLKPSKRQIENSELQKVWWMLWGERGRCHGNTCGLLTQTGEPGNASLRMRFLSWDLKDEQKVNRLGNFYTWRVAFTKAWKRPIVRLVHLHSVNTKCSISKINSINRSMRIKKLLIILQLYVNDNISNRLNINLFYLQVTTQQHFRNTTVNKTERIH